GSAYVFRRDGAAWSQQSKLTSDTASNGDIFGKSVGIAGERIVVSATGDDSPPVNINAGSVYVFVSTEAGWAQDANLLSAEAAFGDGLGSSIAVADDTVVAGAAFDSSGGAGPHAGSACVFGLGPASAWKDMGFGLGGLAGVPQLKGIGGGAAGD